MKFRKSRTGPYLYVVDDETAGGEFIAEITRGSDVTRAEFFRKVEAFDELLEAAKLFWAFYDDLAKSNPGFVGKLCLQDYARWNEALIRLPAAVAKAEGK